MTGTTRTPQPAAADTTRANVEDILPLLPNQLALLLHRDLAVDDPGFLQVRYRIEGPLDVPRYEQAWQDTVAQHPALRMSVKQRNSGEPLGIVWREASLPVDIKDWRAVDDQRDRMARLLGSDRERGIDLSMAPPMRLTLVRTADDVYEAIWTCHHLTIDGWSASVVLEDVMASYGMERPSVASSSPRSLRSYVMWATQQDETQSQNYWVSQLSGFTGNPVLEPDATVTGARYRVHTETISDAMGERIATVAAECTVTPAVLVQAAWAVVMSDLLGNDDVVFGTTVSGRNADVAGIERLVGYLSNAVPVRVAIDPSLKLAAWLATVRDTFFEMSRFEQTSLADIHGWSDVPGHRPLFESFVVIENYPSGDASEDGVVQTEFRSGVTTTYPLTLVVGMSERWFLKLRYDTQKCSPELAEELITHLQSVLEALIDDPQAALGHVMEKAGTLVAPRPQSEDLRAGGRSAMGRTASTETEMRLAAIWSRHLDLADPTVDADYFDLGGSSLGAVRMFQDINSEFDTDLPLSTLLTHPTIAGIASVLTAIHDGEVIETGSLVPIQPNGQKVPIAAVHGGQGEVLFYRGLAAQLGPDQPLYGLQPVGLDGVTDPLDSVPEMASAYIAELQRVQPRGPYRLIGFCFGGTVCLEMAAQLEEQGSEVDFIGIIDGGLPIEAARYESSLQRARYMLRSRGVVGTASAAWRRATWRLSEWRKSSGRRREGDEDLKYVPVALACRRAFNTFEPRRSSAPITLIRSSEQQPGEGKDWDFDWEDFTPELTVRAIDADHKRLFEGPAASQLAHVIRDGVDG